MVADSDVSTTVRGMNKRVLTAVVLTLCGVLTAAGLMTGLVGSQSRTAGMTAEKLTALCGGESVTGVKKSLGSRFCYEEYFEALLDERGPAAAISQLAQWASATGGLAGECHSVGHLLGKYAWAELKMDALKGDTTVCAFSYGHGVLEAASADLPEDEIMRKFANICELGPGMAGCLHGYGHALANIDYSVETVNEICRSQADRDIMDDADRRWNLHFTCMEGWAMEDLFLDPQLWQSLKNTQEAAAICHSIDDAGGIGCRGSALRNYTLVPGVQLPNYNELRAARLDEFRAFCLELTGYEALGCMRHLGMTTSEVWTLEIPEATVAQRVEQICTGEYWSECLGSVVESRWSRFGGSAERVQPLCNALSPRYREACEEVLAKK